jgi:uroporphyrinogen-III synthase
VLVTSAPREGSDVAGLLEAQGAQVSFAPLIRIGPPPNQRDLQAWVDRADEFDWLIFTSAAGVEAFARCRRSPVADKRIAVVGPATAQALLDQLGRTPDLMPERYCGEALADALVGRAHNGAKLLVYAAQDAMPALVLKLRAAGFYVEKVDAYTTVEAAPRDLQALVASNDIVTLASPSAVRALVRGLGDSADESLRGTLLACIGPVTLLEARRAGLHVEIVPESATLASLVDALCAYYQNPRS